MKDYLGNSAFDDILTDDVMVVAYDYNSQEPRFYSKWYAEKKAGIYAQKLELVKDSKGNPVTNAKGEPTGEKI